MASLLGTISSIHELNYEDELISFFHAIQFMNPLARPPPDSTRSPLLSIHVIWKALLRTAARPSASAAAAAVQV